MKTKTLLHLILTLLFFSSICLPALSEDTIYPIRNGELWAGDTMILIYDVGQYDPDMLRAVILPSKSVTLPESCTVCYNDSVWSFKTELYQDTTFYFYFDIPLGIVPWHYNVYFIFGESSAVGGANIYVTTPPFIYQQPMDKKVCEGDAATFEIKALGYGSSTWYHNDVYLSRGNSVTIPASSLEHSGNYYCVTIDQSGSDTSDIVSLDLHPEPSDPGLPVGPDMFCYGTGSTEYSINADPLSTGYTWKLSPEAAGSVQQKDTSAVITWDPAFSGVAELSVELMSENCGATFSDPLEITIPGLSVPPEICIVGIDEETGKYRIVWEDSENLSAQLFRIYRESNQSDVYFEIGTVDPGELNVFTDPASAPDILSHRYKISYMDTCGNESEMSPFHQTIHLTANLGINNQVNLIWSGYMGIPFPAYDIFRGSHPDSMSLLRPVASTVTAITDPDPPTGNVYYQIGISNPAGCNPAKKSGSDYSSSRSNMEQVAVSGIAEISENNLFKIYPNPADEELFIRFKKAFTGPAQFTICNSLGSIVLDGDILSGSASIDVSSLSGGLFILNLLTDGEAYTARFVISR